MSAPFIAFLLLVAIVEGVALWTFRESVIKAWRRKRP